MDNKKLLKILVKDMNELEELISETKTRGTFDVMEMEFLHTRARGITQLLKMLSGFDTPVQKEIEKKPEAAVEKIGTEIKKEKIELHEKKIDVPRKDIVVEEIVEEKIEEVVQKEIEVEETGVVGKNETPPVEIKNEVELEEEVEDINSVQRLGDSFLKEKSVNDLLTDHNNLEFKLSNRPVSSIKSAIGINDRFQYIRELFDGNADKFTETVSFIDEMKNIGEAVEYLRQSFKWKKNETSLKFVGLVKRRFSND